MSQYQREPELGDGLRLHLNENTGGCSPRVLEALARAARRRHRVLSADYDGVDRERARSTSASRRVALAADQRPRRRASWRPPVALPAAGRPAGRCRRRSCPQPAFEMYRVRHARSSAAALVQVMPQAGLRVPARRRARGDHAAHRRGLPDEPEQPDRRAACRSTRFARIARALPAEALRVRRRGLRRLRRRHASSPSCARCPNVIVGRTFAKAYGLAGAAHRRARRRTGRRSTPVRAGRCRPTASTSPRPSALQAALGDRAHLDALSRAGRASRSALLYAACDGSGSTYWTSDANFVLVRVGDRAAALVDGAAPHAASTSATARREPGCAGCIRITDRHRRAHRRARSRRMEEVLCAARVIDRRTTETQIALTLGARGQGPLRRARPASASSITCWSCSRGTAPST